MTRKHFEEIAALLKTLGSTKIPMTHEDFCKSLASYFQNTNPRFKRERFLSACGISDSDQPGER